MKKVVRSLTRVAGSKKTTNQIPPQENASPAERTSLIHNSSGTQQSGTQQSPIANTHSPISVSRPDSTQLEDLQLSPPLPNNSIKQETASQSSTLNSQKKLLSSNSKANPYLSTAVMQEENIELDKTEENMQADYQLDERDVKVDIAPSDPSHAPLHSTTQEPPAAPGKHGNLHEYVRFFINLVPLLFSVCSLSKKK